MGLGLALVALVLVLGMLWLDALLRAMYFDARTINLAGRQRMLCELMTKEVLVHTSGRQGRSQTSMILMERLTEFKRVQRGLLHGDLDLGLKPVAHDRGRKLLEHTMAAHQAVVKTVEHLARLLKSDRASREELDAWQNKLLKQSEDFRRQMDRAVFALDGQARQRLTDSRQALILVLAASLSALGLVILFVFRPAVARIDKEVRDLITAHEQMRLISLSDGLTGIANRRYFDEYLNREWARSRREQRPLSVLMIDIDHFKNYNDAHGHLAGDQVLIKVAMAIKRMVHRPGDMAARFGGEEFSVVLDGTGIEGALAVADAIREEVAALSIEHGSSPAAAHLTVSVGVASVLPDGGDPKALVAAADAALYRAKQAGRNRSEVSGEVPA